MKSFRSIAIAAMMAVVPVMAAGTAWANSELNPAARLVAPYWDVSGDRNTFFFLTNVSRVANLQPNAVSEDQNGTCNLGSIGGKSTNSKCGVHLEFYDKTCENVDTTIGLSRWDIDQLDLGVDSDMAFVKGLDSKLGWADIDVRRGDAVTDSPSVQANVLLGTVLITDSGSDFAVAYPMASSVGSASGGIGYDIVTRIGGGIADQWSGSFETFPARVFVPMFFAEGNNYGNAFASTLAIAGPAQAANFGSGDDQHGEAPGQELSDKEPLVDVSAQVYDACENPQSDSIEEHYIFGTLDELFGPTVTTGSTPPYNTSGGIGTCIYPSADVDRKAVGPFKGGWIDLANRAFGRSSHEGEVEFDQGEGAFTRSYARGLVGVLVQNTASAGDATRLWGDCAYGDSDEGLNSAESGCRRAFNQNWEVSHDDIKR